jgi:hypothetical protein
MVKFPQADRDGYVKARNELQKFADEAVFVIEERYRRTSINSM